MKVKKDYFVTCEKMKCLERLADSSGLSYYQMMENAGSGAAKFILEKTSKPTATKENLSVLLFCGKGNNGGDGFVVARLLHEAGYNSIVVLVDGKPKTEDAVINFEILKSLPVKILDMSEDSSILNTESGHPNLIVDAIYGTGFHGSLSGNALIAAEFINKYSKENQINDAGAYCNYNENCTAVFALDIPSGLSGNLTDQDCIDSNSVCAQYTLTFHAKKPVHLQNAAQKYCGKTIVIDIGINEERLSAI